MANHILAIFRNMPPPEAFASGWVPSADIYRTSDGWLVKFDLAGVHPEDVELAAHGNRLQLRGVRRDACLTEACHCYQMEISYSRFERVIMLPTDLEHAHIAADHRHGMLLVRIRLEVERP